MGNKFLLGLMFSGICILSHAQGEFPAYEQVVNEFFNRYDLKDNQNYRSIRFVKKEEGYFLEVYNRESKSYTDRQLFWSAEKEEYSKLPFPENEKSEKESIEKLLKDWNADKFDLYPWYGYVNWEIDVIDYFEAKDRLTHDELYALGRAYSNAASNLLNNNSGFADSTEMFSLAEFGNNQFRTGQLAGYRYYRHKAIEAFGRLCRSAPGYPTIVGSVCTKYYNEYLTSFLDIRMYHNEEEALKELPDSLYSSCYLEMARNYLGSCDTNSILFTNGDNDTYPLLYLQAKYNYRPDVLVVNMALLNNNNYINHFRYGNILQSDSLHMILYPENYARHKQAYTFVKKSSAGKGFMELSEALRLIRDTSPVTNNKHYPDYRFLASDKLQFSPGSQKSVEFTLENRYLSKGELMALDIICSNSSERPVYFIYNNSLGLTDHMELNGFAYKLVDTTTLIDEYHLFGGVNAGKTFHQLMHEFSPGACTAVNNVVLSSYQRSFCQLAAYYANQGLNDRCRLIVDQYLEVIPDNVYEMDFGLLPMVDAAYQAGLIREGDHIAATILENLQNQLDQQELSDSDIQVIGYTASNLQRLIMNEELLIRIEKILEEI